MLRELNNGTKGRWVLPVVEVMPNADMSLDCTLTHLSLMSRTL